MARILQVFRPRTGGTFGHVGRLSRELAAGGHEVAVCGPAPGDAGVDFGVPFIEAAIPREVAPLRAGRGIRDVGRAYRSFRPDLIHAHGAQAGVIARLARAALPSVPLVHTPHRYAFCDGRGRTAANVTYETLERGLMPLTSMVLCVCEAERDLATRIGAGERARVVHNGIGPLEPAPVPAGVAGWLANGDGPVIVAVAELFHRKGVEVLLEAMPAVLAADPRARLLVAGDGPERASVESARQRLGLESSVLLAGQVEGVAGLLELADVFVNPALAEAFPYGVLEAMAAGCPCVVTDAGGTAEAIVDGVCGIVVEPADAEGLASGISALLDDRALAGRFGDAARERVGSRFTLDGMVQGTLAAYAELAEASDRGID